MHDPMLGLSLSLRMHEPMQSLNSPVLDPKHPSYMNVNIGHETLTFDIDIAGNEPILTDLGAVWRVLTQNAKS